MTCPAYSLRGKPEQMAFAGAPQSAQQRRATPSATLDQLVIMLCPAATSASLRRLGVAMRTGLLAITFALMALEGCGGAPPSPEPANVLGPLAEDPAPAPATDQMAATANEASDIADSSAADSGTAPSSNCAPPPPPSSGPSLTPSLPNCFAPKLQVIEPVKIVAAPYAVEPVTAVAVEPQDNR